MIDNFALSIGSTGSWTGVSTLLLDTGLGQRTLRTEETLRPAVGRGTEVSRQAVTDRPVTLGPALAVGATGVRVARIRGLGDDRGH